MAASMLGNILPPSADNTYRRHKLALWIMGVVVLMKVTMSLNSILNGRLVAQKADGLPLDSYPVAAARTILALLALWAFAHLILSLLGILALVRYRSMVPFVFVLLLLEHLGRKLIIQLIPIARSVSAPAASAIKPVQRRRPAHRGVGRAPRAPPPAAIPYSE